jgi:hypothetical protein
MPKAKLTFNLPEEQEDFDIACKANKMHSFIFELNHNFRRKFRDRECSAEEVLDELLELAKDCEVQDI